ncbi:MAG: 3-deoxy-7-phosphoheptulonate synthase, partial [Acidimicrobiales bacterium]
MANVHWAPNTWRDFQAAQQPEWPDASEADRVYKQLATLPPLVFAGEARILTHRLSQVAAG